MTTSRRAMYSRREGTNSSRTCSRCLTHRGSVQQSSCSASIGLWRRGASSWVSPSNSMTPTFRTNFPQRFSLGRDSRTTHSNTTYGGEKPSRYVQDCRAHLARFFGNYEDALQAWDNLLTRSDVPHPPIRRQIVWTLLRRRDEAWTALRSNEVGRVRKLLEDNLQEDPNDSTSLRLWLRAVRLPPTAASLDHVIERVTYRKANTNSWDAAYYLYVLHTFRALDGSTQGGADAERALDECRGLTRFRRDRTRSFEWLGEGDGISRLVHESRLGDWKDDFWDDTGPLVRVKGKIKSIGGPQKGIVEVNGAVDAFFVPAKAGFYEGRDENVSVDFYLGFSYDGP